MKKQLSSFIACSFVLACSAMSSVSAQAPAPETSTTPPSIAAPPGVGVPPGSLLCIDGECRPAISNTTYDGRPAYTLTDGRSQAIIVPSIGRVMHYGLIGGKNWLWKAPARPYKEGEWRNYGGAKTWPAPQSDWAIWDTGWPPPKAWDAEPHEDEVLTGGHLRLTSHVAAGLGARLIREFYFAPSGEFVIEQTVEKLSGEPRQISLWSVAQVVSPTAVFLPLNGDSAYRNGFHLLQQTKAAPVWKLVGSNLLQVEPTRDGSFKIGVDAPVAAIAAVSGREAFVQRAARTNAQYPDGALKAGFPVEYYSYADERNAFSELELLSPLRTARPGDKWTHTVRWSLHTLPSDDLEAPNVPEAIVKLLFPASL